MKRIYGIYNITDCEHFGDIEREKQYLMSFPSLTIESVFWDRKDCGKAYIKFSILEKYFNELYFKLDALFDADINEYISYDNKYMAVLKQFQAPYYNRKDFINLLNEKSKHLFIDKINYSLFFEISNLSEIQITDIINQSLKCIGVKANIIAFNINISDGSTYLNALIDGLLIDYSPNKLRGFGNCCIANYGSFLGRNNIYGQLNVNSILDNKKQPYNIIHNKFLKKENIIYYDGQYYYPKKIEVPYNECINKNGLINDIIIKDNKEFYIW